MSWILIEIQVLFCWTFFRNKLSKWNEIVYWQRFSNELTISRHFPSCSPSSIARLWPRPSHFPAFYPVIGIEYQFDCSMFINNCHCFIITKTFLSFSVLASWHASFFVSNTLRPSDTPSISQTAFSNSFRTVTMNLKIRAFAFHCNVWQRKFERS